MKPEMSIFPNWIQIPIEFEGLCLVDNEITYLKKGKIIHNDNGPARIKITGGMKVWVINNQTHRIGAPAIEWIDGYIDDQEHYYYINGKRYSKQDYWRHPLVSKHKLDLILKL